MTENPFYSRKAQIDGLRLWSMALGNMAASSSNYFRLEPLKPVYPAEASSLPPELTVQLIDEDLIEPTTPVE
jgi:hypothetical protein